MRQMLATAIEAEVQGFLVAREHLVDAAGHRRLGPRATRSSETCWEELRGVGARNSHAAQKKKKGRSPTTKTGE
jgi:hypothetical protein